MVLGLILGIIYLFWDFLYWAKWTTSFVSLWLRKKIHRRRFDLYNYETDSDPEKIGVLIPREEKILESPFPEEHLQNAADEVFIYGVNTKSEALLVRVSRFCKDESEAWIYLKLCDGRWYELDQTAGFQRSFGAKCSSFTCGGLQMYHMEAMRRWRITYCGMLRERTSANEAGNKSVFVKFSFLWTASSEVYDASCDLDIKSTAEAMAKAKWNSLFPPLHGISEALNFYCQSGIVTGMVSVEQEPDIEMYLFGERIRFMGKSSYLTGSKFKHVLGVAPESGLILHLGKASIPNLFHNMYFGFIVHPNGNVYTIEDGLLIANLSKNDAEKENLILMFKTARENYELRGNFADRGLRFTRERGWNGQVDLVGTEFEIDGYTGSGFMLSGEVSKIPETKIEQIPQLLPSSLPFTVYFTDDTCSLTHLTGGKGSSLGKLTKFSNKIKSEFTVPKGIVVTTVAYEEFLTSEIIQKIENLKNIAYGNVKGNVHEACKIVASAVESAYLPDKITKDIEEKLNKLFDDRINNYKFAVRSSATGEDTDQMSAAGQMDTFLGVQGLIEILTAVKKCWASQFSYIATEYKRQNGQILNSPMAVVIQKMVECEAAGVLFTCDPVTNNPSVTVITGNYGLGESVVSGSEEPDTIVLEKLPKGDVKIKSVTLGLKEHKVVTADGKGIVTEDVTEEEKGKCCISEEMAVKLGKLSLKIENHFKSPRDIEWGLKNDSIYILQSRPITTGSTVPDYEIKHEFDGPLRCEKEFFTRSNVGEVMPGAASPLGLDMVNKHFSLVFQKKEMRQRQRNNFQQSKYFPTGILSFSNHLMITVADILTRVNDYDSVDSQSMMMGLFGRLLDDPDLYSEMKRKKYDPLKRSLAYYVMYLKNLFFCGYGIDRIKEKVFNYEIPAEKGKKANEIFSLLVHSSNHHVEPYLKHMICSEMSALWNMVMFSVLEKSKGTIDNEVYSDFAKLLASCSNVESANVPLSMQNLALSIVKDMKVEPFREMTVEEAQKWLETSNTSASYKYHEFLKRHGHRCLKEFDVYTIPWNEDPKPLIKLLQNMSGSCEDTTKKKEEGLSDILPHLAVPLNWKFRLLLMFILPNSRRGVREREACKSNLIKSVDNTRKGFRHLSKAMVAEGYLPDTELIYFLTLNEINDLLDSRNPRLIARANHRRKLFPLVDALQYPEFSKGRPIPVNEIPDGEEIEYVPDLTMTGIPVSQGSVKGYARVAVSLEEAAHLKPGEILITVSTDIGWSPYFPILGGVVTELGGLICHGAVVSREYGLPCVVALHGATRQFETGDYVHLDGNKGILQRLSPPESEQI